MSPRERTSKARVGKIVKGKDGVQISFDQLTEDEKRHVRNMRDMGYYSSHFVRYRDGSLTFAMGKDKEGSEVPGVDVEVDSSHPRGKDAR
jgi:hypothetical protein